MLALFYNLNNLIIILWIKFINGAIIGTNIIIKHNSHDIFVYGTNLITIQKKQHYNLF